MTTTTAPPTAPLLSDLIDLDTLADEIEAGYVTRKRHPELPLSIYCYTNAAQYTVRWNPVTRRCRGLIVDDITCRVAGFAFPKFFEIGQRLPDALAAAAEPREEPFEVYDKVDGSLGTIFHHTGAWRAASKSSFTSNQARWATRWLARHPAHEQLLEPGNTYVTEIVYPGNRLVVDYGQTATLVLLAVYRPDGTEAPLDEFAAAWQQLGGQLVQRWPAVPIAQLRGYASGNTRPSGGTCTGTDAEGFVIRYASGHRLKVKYEEYRRLAKTLKHFNNRDIWRAAAVAALDPGLSLKRTASALMCPTEEIEALRTHEDPLSGLLSFASEHFATWARNLFDAFTTQVAELTAEIEQAHRERLHLAGDRRAYHASLHELPKPVAGGALLALSGADFSLHVWHQLHPAQAIDYTDPDDDA